MIAACLVPLTRSGSSDSGNRNLLTQFYHLHGFDGVAGLNPADIHTRSAWPAVPVLPVPFQDIRTCLPVLLWKREDPLS